MCHVHVCIPLICHSKSFFAATVFGGLLFLRHNAWQPIEQCACVCVFVIKETPKMWIKILAWTDVYSLQASTVCVFHFIHVWTATHSTMSLQSVRPPAKTICSRIQSCGKRYNCVPRYAMCCAVCMRLCANALNPVNQIKFILDLIKLQNETLCTRLSLLFK